jgi:hypothetical protein
MQRQAPRVKVQAEWKSEPVATVEKAQDETVQLTVHPIGSLVVMVMVMMISYIGCACKR